MNKNTVYTTLYMHNSQFLSTNHYCCTANKPSQPVLSHILQAYLKISIVRWLIIHYKVFCDWPPKKNRKVYLGQVMCIKEVAHRYAIFLCSWDDSLVGQLTIKEVLCQRRFTFRISILFEEVQTSILSEKIFLTRNIFLR